MIYAIRERLELTDTIDDGLHVLLFSSKEFEEKRAEYGIDIIRAVRTRHFRYCKAERYLDYIAGTIAVPKKKNNGAIVNFIYYIKENNIIIIDDVGTAAAMLKKISEEKLWTAPSVELFLYDFFTMIIDNDFLYIEKTEELITEMEDKALITDYQSFNGEMTEVRRELLSLYNYYSQLMEVWLVFQKNDNDFFDKKYLYLFRLMYEQIGRLQSSVKMLREYSVQVREIYQAQVDIKQNKIMKIFTVVTSIFYPLTLLTGWYGMNFEFMPELSSPWGYPAVIAVGAVIVIIGVITAVKKKFF